MDNINLKVSGNFSGTTITGVDMQVKFGFPEEFFGGSGQDVFDRALADGDKRIWFTIGTITQIRYAMQRDASPKYTLKEMNPLCFNKGIRMTQGDMVWKNFDRDALKQVLDKINTFEEGIDLAVINNSPLISASTKDAAEMANSSFVKESDGISYWDQLPLFDIMVISKTSDVGNKKPSHLLIKDVKITDNGFAESIDSTEMNDIVQFVSISGVESWKMEV